MTYGVHAKRRRANIGVVAVVVVVVPHKFIVIKCEIMCKRTNSRTREVFIDR